MARKSKFIVLGVLGFAALILFVYHDLIFRPAPSYAKNVGHTLPDPILRDTNGKELKLSELIKQTGPETKVILSFWATWCGPCTQELPEIERAVPDFKKAGIQVHLINYDSPMPDKTVPEVKAWLISQKINLTTYFDFSEELTKTLDVSALPFTVGIQDGTVRWMEVGELEWTKTNAFASRFK